MNQAPPQDGAVTLGATILLAGQIATGIRGPGVAAEQLDAGKHPRGRATINGYAYRNAVGVAPAHALAQNPPDQDLVNSRSSSDQQRFVLTGDGTKTDVTRQRRIATSLAAPREERT